MSAGDALIAAMGQTRQEAERVIGQWMAEHKADPKKHLLALPMKYKDQLPAAVWPDYVMFSPLVVAPIVMARPSGRRGGLAE